MMILWIDSWRTTWDRDRCEKLKEACVRSATCRWALHLEPGAEPPTRTYKTPGLMFVWKTGKKNVSKKEVARILAAIERAERGEAVEVQVGIRVLSASAWAEDPR